MVVILAAGKGSRMGKADIAKVCFEIDSVPAINRIISTFKSKRFNNFLLIIGSKAEDAHWVVRLTIVAEWESQVRRQVI